MVDIKKIMSLTTEEIEVVDKLQEMRRTAAEMESLVRAAYTFKIGEDRICLLSDVEKDEYITHNGIWKRRESDNDCEVKCTKDEILKCLIAEYAANSETIFADFKAETIGEFFRYFRAFIERTKKEHPELCHASEDT